MVRIASVVSSGFLIVASALSLCNDQSSYEVTVDNLTYMQPFSLIVLVAHTEDITVFETGAASTDEFRELAETGDPSALQAALVAPVNECCLCGLVIGPEALSPGFEQTLTITVNDTICPDGPLFSMASMLVNTNDAFWGINAMSPAKGVITMVETPALDAGTEENNELCSHIPGSACSETSGNLQTESGEGFIHVHRGVHGVGSLADDIFDWRSPVAKITISS